MEISQEENQTNEKKERQTLKNGMEKEEHSIHICMIYFLGEFSCVIYRENIT
jgi:hypothetical protein